jgi:RNA polymerase sigma factor (sigma-70 family)
MATAVRTPEADLLLRLRAREREAWEELYAAYQPRLRAFAYRLSGNVHDADDLVQETFVRAVPRLDRLDPETADVGAYLFTTLRNLFLKQVERGKRQQSVAEVPEPSGPARLEDGPEVGALLRRQQEEVRVANSRLQPRQRLVLALRELEDRSYAEIGEIVGMKENAVAQLIFRARESLRVELRLVQVDPERLPEQCRRFLPLLAAHLDGQLKGARRDETLAHLDGCERCQSVLADMREASRRYRSLLPLLLESDEAKAATERRLEEVGYWARRPRRFGRRSLAVAIAVAAAVLAGGGGAVAVVLSREVAHDAALTTPTPDGTMVAPIPGATTGTPERSTTPTSPAKPTPTTPAKTKPKTTKTSTKGAEPAPPPTSTRTTTADRKPPTVVITAAPAGVVTAPAASIAFRASEPGVTFTCRLDGGASARCTSPASYQGLAVGAHTFAVRATDGTGNVGPEVFARWTYTPPDTSPPSVRLTSAPPARTSETRATFSFAADEGGVTFSCSLDGAAEASCASPATYAALGVGAHTFAVRATDGAGNTGPAASHQWTVVELLPDLVVSVLGKSTVTIANRGNASAGASTLTITLVGTFSVPALAPGASATFSWSTCRVGTYSAIADRTNAVRESDEGNNTASRRNTCP